MNHAVVLNELKVWLKDVEDGLVFATEVLHKIDQLEEYFD